MLEPVTPSSNNSSLHICCPVFLRLNDMPVQVDPLNSAASYWYMVGEMTFPFVQCHSRLSLFDRESLLAGPLTAGFDSTAERSRRTADA
jgi:hypothetical protein